VRDVIFVTTVPIARIGPLVIKLRDGYALQSGNYRAGVAGWTIRDDGSVEFHGTGKIGGWTIGATRIYSDLAELNAQIPALRLGTATGFMTGVGFWVGRDVDNVYKLHIGDPNGEFLSWDGHRLSMIGSFTGQASIAPDPVLRLQMSAF
jgi:hypothetical protein